MEKANFEKFQDILNKKKPDPKKAPAHRWQDLALQVIDKIKPPPHKRSAVFKVCKEYPKEVVEQCLADTLELCQSGEKWRYFFKVVAGRPKSSKYRKNK